MSARFFNTAGPVNYQDHYCLPPLSRFELGDILTLIAQKKYFLLHAPRQTGKTTCLLALTEYLNRAGQYRALYTNIEGAQAARENIELGIAGIVQAIAKEARWRLGETGVESLAEQTLSSKAATVALEAFLNVWCQQSSQPTVLMLDEVDALVGDTLIALLRQLRAGYASRPGYFPQSVILCGVRDLRDYRIHSDREKAIISGGSAFNIKAESLRLGDFSQEEMTALYAQHSAESGQEFTADALEVAWNLTQGQPWLVNALGYEACFRMKEGRDRSLPITAESFQQAKENLILRRETHLDQLADKLREERVRRVIVPLLSGDISADLIPGDDIAYVYDLGLIRTKGQLAIANPIYREIIPRELTYGTQLTIPYQPVWYIQPNGRLDMDKLLAAFQEFFRENSEHWVERFQYKEAGPQLLMQAFLQRIVNAGGRIEREYGLGQRRTDLLVIWKVREESTEGGRWKDGRQSSQSLSPDLLPTTQKVVIELKLLRGSLEQALAEGLPQTWDYADHCGAEEAHLIIFDRTPGKSWEEKLFRREEIYRGKPITVWGA
jgi:hypothetical protein